MLHEAGYLKVADFGLGKLLDASSAQTDMYSMTGETGSCKWNPFFSNWFVGQNLQLWYVVLEYGYTAASAMISEGFPTLEHKCREWISLAGVASPYF